MYKRKGEMSTRQKTREVPLSQGAVSDAYLMGRKVLPVANISYWDFMSVLLCAYLRPRKKSMAVHPYTASTQEVDTRWLL